jgi:hypothetical protein
MRVVVAIRARRCATFAGIRLAIALAVQTMPPAIVDVMMARFGREYEVTSIVRRIAAVSDLAAAVRVLEDSIPSLIGSSRVTCVREPLARAWSPGIIVEPIARTGWVLVARRPPLVPDFGSIETSTLAALASAIAPAIRRLLESPYTSVATGRGQIGVSEDVTAR